MGKKIFFGAVCTVGLASLAFFYPLRVLSLTADDRVVLFRVIKAGDTFRLGYLHSVALSDVWDNFTIDEYYHIVLTQTRFQGQGAGLPYTPAAGETWHRDGTWFRITGMKRVVPFISWRVQKKWHGRFQFGKEPEIDFSARLGDALVRIGVQQITGWQWAELTFRKRGNESF